jgi:hypothetical protein
LIAAQRLIEQGPGLSLSTLFARGTVRAHGAPARSPACRGSSGASHGRCPVIEGDGRPPERRARDSWHQATCRIMGPGAASRGCPRACGSIPRLPAGALAGALSKLPRSARGLPLGTNNTEAPSPIHSPRGSAPVTTATLPAARPATAQYDTTACRNCG